MPNFVGPGRPLSQDGFDAARQKIGAPAPAIWSVISVETKASGYLPDRRPQILFERHIFSRLTGHRFDQSHPGVSQPTSGGYGAGGAHQYDRLAEALALDESAALMSASWGLGQVMGENHQAAGFPDVQSMVEAFVASEDAQFAGMAGFIVANNLAGHLANQRWTDFAKHYNGPGFAKNDYPGKLQRFFAQYSAGPTPDLSVRAAQTYLTYKGHAVGIDGVSGPQTQAAVKAFQAANGLQPTGVVDAALLQRLAQ
jgi:hypothetical protein